MLQLFFFIDNNLFNLHLQYNIDTNKTITRFSRVKKNVNNFYLITTYINNVTLNCRSPTSEYNFINFI